MPGDDLLFQRLSVSTIGADWFHGRVRDGIGWVTDAMVTKQWSRRALCVLRVLIDAFLMMVIWLVVTVRHRLCGPAVGLVLQS